MSDRSERISRLKADRQARESYIKAKIGMLVPSQIRALRLKSKTPKQTALAKVAGTHQSRLSNLERPGEANVTLETLAWIAAVHKVGLIVKFASFSEMLHWENDYSQDEFNVTRLDEDEEFINPGKAAEISSFQVGSAGRAYKVYDIELSPGKDDAVLEAITSVPTKNSFKHSEMVPNG